MAAEGEVEIYIEHERDMSAMKKVVKLLMTFNDKVTLIKFKVNSTVYLDMVYQRIHDWIEVRALIIMGKSFFLYFNVFFLKRFGDTTRAHRGVESIWHRSKWRWLKRRMRCALGNAVTTATPSSEKFAIETCIGY